MAKAPPAPRTFFLNEQHELARGEKGGGAGKVQFGEIDWEDRGARLGQALRKAKATIQASKDPVRDRHFFLCAVPRAVPKVSTSKSKPGAFDEPTHYAGEQSRIFRRLGIDLIDVSNDGIATVHATPDRVERLLSTAFTLQKETLKERARWVTLDTFEAIPSSYRVDAEWLKTVPTKVASDVIVELQPLLGRVAVEEILAALAKILSPTNGESFTGTGSDFSGRKWFRARMRQASIAEIAEHFYSVQSLHSPQVTPVAARVRTIPPAVARAMSGTMPAPSTGQLPTVAVLDTGVPAGHAELGPYRRGAYQWPDASAAFLGNHGSLVASRIVFGDLDFSAGEKARPPGACQFLDVMVARSDDAIEDKAVLTALEAVVATYPDVRVFNLSFAQKSPSNTYSAVAQREALLLVQDLDNFAFARDVVVVVAAGNAEPGIIPINLYPLHLNEEPWQLPAWPSGFNTLACGSTVETLHPEALVKTIGAPSPFTRVGPGIARAPIPEFGAHGGNATDAWQFRASLGVWGCTSAGDWEDHSGTSFAAPLLARQVALTLKELQRFCPPGVRPFGVTAKAFLRITAVFPDLPPPVAALAERTIGCGRADPTRLGSPRPSSALFLWQGVIDGNNEIVRVQLPIPIDWLEEAVEPELRLVCCWDPPVNEATRDTWACRQVTARLRPGQDEKALLGRQQVRAGSYPLIDRVYNLAKNKLAKLKTPPGQSLWNLELAYEQIAEYYPAITFASQQRVAFAAELRDVGSEPLSPQESVQRLPTAMSMIRLGIPGTPLEVPIILRRTT